MDLGIIGLPQTGKKTVFELLTGISPAQAPTKSGVTYGIAAVRDPRVDSLTAMYKPRRTKYAEFAIALPPDVLPEAARSADWLEPLRKVDAFLHVVRAFESPSVFHVRGSIDPARDLELVETELLLADLELVEKRLHRMQKEAMKKTASQDREKALLERFGHQLGEGLSLRTLEISQEDATLVRSLQFLTLKPMIVVFNVGENLLKEQAQMADLKNSLESQGVATVFLSAALEAELVDLTEDERADFMADLGITEPAAHRLSRAAFECLGLISFFTVGPDEVRAWPVRRGATAPEAAGRIHSDLERGFIRAETVAYDDLVKAGSEKAAKESNLFRLNGKDYVVQDGDVLNIRFSV